MDRIKKIIDNRNKSTINIINDIIGNKNEKSISDIVAPTILAKKYLNIKDNNYKHGSIAMHLEYGDKTNEITLLTAFGSEVIDIISYLPNLTSADGEYRSNIITMEYYLYLENIFDMDSIMEFSEEFLSDKTIIYRGPLKPYLEKLDINFIFSIILINLDTNYREYYSNICPLYEVLENNIISYRNNKIKDIINNIKSYKTKTYLISPKVGKDIKMHAGLKIIPMTIYSMEYPYDLRLSIWRELIISKLIHNIVANGICNNFPVLIDWFIGSHDSVLYNNAINRTKFIMSKQVDNIIDDVKDIQHKVHDIHKSIALLTIKRLGQKLEIPLKYAEREILLSDHCMGMIFENLGYTIPSIINISKYNDNFIIYKSMYHIECMCMDLIYDLWCMNKYYNIIHCDPHLNNITVRLINYVKNVNNPNSKIAFLYYVKELDTIYIQKNIFAKVNLIDFSRSIFWSEDIISNMFVDKFYVKNENINILLRYLSKHMAEFFIRNESNIRRIAHKNYIGFHYMCEALDPLFIFNNMKLYFNDMLKDDTPELFNGNMIKNLAIPYLDNIVEKCKKYIRDTYALLIDGKSVNERINLSLLKLFNSHNHENTQLDKDTIIINIMSTMNNIDFDITKDNWLNIDDEKYMQKEEDKLKDLRMRAKEFKKNKREQIYQISSEDEPYIL